MINPSFDRLVRPGDAFYRKLNPLTWDSNKGTVFDIAFEDQYDDLSLFCARATTPIDVLIYFSRFRGFRRFLFRNEKPAGATELWSAGVGVGVISYEAVVSFGLRFKIYDGGYTAQESGHVEVLSGQEWSLELSSKATALTANEIFGSTPTL